MKKSFGDPSGKAFQGSGGVGNQGGKGGGAIWIHASNVFNLDGIVEAKGGDSQTVIGSSTGSGGGSGGSISINTVKISSTSDAVISVAGGKGTYGGGGGSGGWIYGSMNALGKNKTRMESTLSWKGIFNLSAGISDLKSDPDKLSLEKDTKDVHIGRTGHANCSAGFEGVFCSPCILGFFQSSESTELCRA